MKSRGQENVNVKVAFNFLSYIRYGNDIITSIVKKFYTRGEKIKKAKHKISAGVVFSWIGIVIIVTFFFFPILWEVLASFKSSIEVRSPNPTLIFQPSFENWEYIFIGREFLSNFKNSIIVVSCTTILTVLIGALAAYALATVNFKGRKLLALEIITLRMLPPASVIVPIFLLLKKASLINTLPGLIIVYITFNLPLSCWLLMQYFTGIPQEIREAALIDGSSWSKNLWTIVFPLAKPGLVAVTIFCLIFSWSEFLFALILTSEETHTLPIVAAAVLQHHYIHWGGLAASCVFIMALPLFFIFVVQKHFVKGLTLGAIK